MAFLLEKFGIKKSEPELAQCIVCAESKASITQQECKHSVLCATCAFRLAFEARICLRCHLERQSSFEIH